VMRLGPIWRSANHIPAIGAPAEIISSPTITRSIDDLSYPPCFLGQLMPIQPSDAIICENSDEYPFIQLSVNRPNFLTPSAATFAARSLKSLSSGAKVKLSTLTFYTTDTYFPQKH